MSDETKRLAEELAISKGYYGSDIIPVFVAGYLAAHEAAEAELADLQQRLYSSEQKHSDDISAYESVLSASRERERRLRVYAAHTEKCRFWRMDGNCTCGLHEALAETGEGRGE